MVVGSPMTTEWSRLEKLWGQYIDSGTLDNNLNDTIAASWQRCRSASVDPNGGTCSKIYDGEQLRQLLESNKTLLEIASPMVESVYQSVQGSGFMVVLVNKEGIILKTFGDHKILEKAQLLNFHAGANWTEESVGTNAIGTCLATGIPIQVTGPEHFCSSHHSWTCSAAPIHSPSGQILGCLDMSGPYEKIHPHTLGMVTAAGWAINNQLRKELTSMELSSTVNHLEAVVDSISEGVLHISSDGKITGANIPACKLLSRPFKELVGQKTDYVLGAANVLKRVLTAGQGHYQEDIVIDTPVGPLRCTVTAKPIANHEKAPNGAVVILRKNLTVNELGAGGRQLEYENKTRGIYILDVKNEDPDNKSRIIGEKDQACLPFKAIVGRSRQICAALDRATRAAAGCSTVLLLGESGTGKEVFAQAIHNASGRRNGPFMPVNCASMPAGLVQSELFGYSEGAFTGAKRGGQPGKFEMANGGTFFLDEIGDMPLDIQANLLRVLQEKAVMRVGGNKIIPVDVRIIAATNKDLYREVLNRNFREDLFYRINVLTIEIPPLREREGDLDLLIEHFLAKLSARLGKIVNKIEPSAMELLSQYHWPGNVRELANILEQAMIITDENIIKASHLPRYLSRACPQSTSNARKNSTLVGSLEQVEINAIKETLAHFQGNISKTAKALGIGRNTLYVKINKYKIQL